MVRACIFLLSIGISAHAASAPDLLSQIHSGNHSAVQKLLRSGVDVNAKDEDGTSALMHAVIESDTDMVKLLIAAGAAVNAQNEAGSTASSTSLMPSLSAAAVGWFARSCCPP